MTEYPRKSINTTAVLDPKTRAAIDEWAKQDNRSVSNLLESIIKQAIERREQEAEAKPKNGKKG